jgi:hypothetical protein
MFALATTYAVAIGAMLFSGISALTLIYTVSHLDLPDVRTSPEHAAGKVAA